MEQNILTKTNVPSNITNKRKTGKPSFFDPIEPKFVINGVIFEWHILLPILGLCLLSLLPVFVKAATRNLEL